MTIVVKGFRVVEPAPDGIAKPKPLSRLYPVKAAAEQFIELARRAGHPAAMLETVYGSDDCGDL
jgi:hypothetical protein